MDITLYHLHKNSNSLFPIERADYKRDWMDEYPHSFAYRCLPLKIANEVGWLVRCPVNFDAEYITDNNAKNSVRINIDGDQFYKNYITSHFGRGVITFSLPYIFRTPDPWCIWARGYPNYYKDNVNFLEGIIETYWLHSTFTYNIRLVEKHKTVSFKKGEPLMFITCINIKSINNACISETLIDDNIELKSAFDKWNISRSDFNKKLNNPEDWQKDYFKGLNAKDTVEQNHLTTIKTHIRTNNE